MIEVFVGALILLIGIVVGASVRNLPGPTGPVGPEGRAGEPGKTETDSITYGRDD